MEGNPRPRKADKDPFVLLKEMLESARSPPLVERPTANSATP